MTIDLTTTQRIIELCGVIAAIVGCIVRNSISIKEKYDSISELQYKTYQIAQELNIIHTENIKTREAIARVETSIIYLQNQTEQIMKYIINGKNGKDNV